MNAIEKLVNKLGIYNQARFSALPNALVEMLTSKTAKNIAYYKSFLPPVAAGSRPLIFDVGANKGNKTRAFLDMGYKVVCVDPELKSLETLKYRYGNNKNVTIVNKGVSDKVGKLTLHIQDYRSGYNTLSDKWVDALQDSEHNRWNKKLDFIASYEVETTTLDNLIKEFGDPLYVKIDVEGHELAVIKGLTRPVPYLSFEANLPEFVEESKAIVQHLIALSPDVTFTMTDNDERMSDEWMNAASMMAFLNNAEERVVEVIARTAV